MAEDRRHVPEPSGVEHQAGKDVAPCAAGRPTDGATHRRASRTLEDVDDADDKLPFQRLDAYVVAKEIARRVHKMKIADSELRDQATRAAKSTFLRLSEGLPNEGAAMRRKYFTEANNSLHELLGAMDLAAAIDVARADEARVVQRLGVRLKRMLRALVH